MSDWSLRWMIRCDFDAVLRIDRESHIDPWDAETFERLLRHRNVIGQVVLPARWHSGEPPVVGFMVYQAYRGYLRVLRLAVCPRHRRRGVGAAMVEKLQSKCNQGRGLRWLVSEDDLPTQLWLRACGIRAVGLYREREAIVFDWRPKVEVA